MKLCCIFNYSPLYRESIYKQIDEAFDTQFVWEGRTSSAKKLDDCIFKRTPLKNKKYKSFPWTTKVLSLIFGGYDAYIITFSSTYSILLLLLWCRITRKPVYAWGHGFLHRPESLRKRTACRLLTGFLCYSEKRRDRLVELGMNPGIIHVIYNSLTHRFDPATRVAFKSNILKYHFGNDFPVIVFVGRLMKKKQLDWILKAQRRHKMENFRYNSLLIGDGEIYDDLYRLSLESGLSENVWFYGACYNEEKLGELIYNADLCVSPGNVGLTALNSMMFGTPVLTHNSFENQMPEYEIVVEGKTGALYEYGNFDDFCNQIKNCLSNNDNRDTIRHNCYEVINGKWNSDYQISVISSLLSE